MVRRIPWRTPIAGPAAALAMALASGCSSQPLPAPEGWDREPSRIVRSLRGEGDLRAGAARVSLDPPYAVPMGGYFGGNYFLLRRQRDHISARAVVLEAGGLRLALVAIDLALVTRELRPLVEESAEFRGARLDGWTVFASHDHTSLGSFAPEWPAQAFGIGFYDPLVLRYVARQCARAVAEASERLEPVDIAVGQAAPPPGSFSVSFNRKVEGGPADPTVRALELVPRGGASPGAKPIRLVDFAGHPTMIPARLRSASADYPGVLCGELERDGSTALFLNGPEGDIAAGMYEDERHWWRRRMPLEGARIAGLAREALRHAERRPGARAVLAYVEGEVLLPPRHPWHLPFIGRSVAEVYPDRIRARCIRIDDVALLFFPGEMGNDLGLGVMADMLAPSGAAPEGGSAAAAGPRTAWLVGLADDYLGYVFSEEEYAHGGHSQHLTIYGDEMGPHLRRRLPDIARAAFAAPPDVGPAPDRLAAPAGG